MADKFSESRLRELEEKVRLLTLENDQLAERAEETLLLGLVAEKINTLEDVNEVLKVGLEQTALLKGLPYAACYTWRENSARGLHLFALFENEEFGQADIPLAEELVQKLEGGTLVLRGAEHTAFPYHEEPGCLFRPQLSFIIPVGTQLSDHMLLVFAMDQDPDRLAAMHLLLPRVGQMLSERIDNLELLSRLQSLNEDLDGKVRERTVKLRDSQRRLRTLFESALDSFMVIDRDLVVREVNPEGCRILGYEREELQGKTVTDFVHGKSRSMLENLWFAAQRSEVMRVDSIHQRKDGSTFPVEVQLGPIQYGGEEMVLAQTRDMTERNRLREQLSQAQKMEAVGRLAGGIAHDFNNILTTIMGHVDLLKMDLTGNDRAIEDLEQIQETTEKAARLTRQLLAFSRKQVLEMAPFRPNEVLKALTGMLERMITESIELQLELDPQAGFIFGDSGRFEQIIINLVINARDAMPEGGRLKLTTRCVPADESFSESSFQEVTPTGRLLEITVVDTGTGIPEEMQGKIFDPFFTTKDVGKGSGLGLAMVYGLVRQHHGTIRVESEPGRGTSFRIFLPEVEAAAEKIPQRAEAEPSGGRETILLVEDDDASRQVLSRMVTRLGYNLLAAENGLKALELARTLDRPVDLLLTDVIMPRVSGGALAAKLRERWPDLKVIFISGYTDETLAGQDLSLSDTLFLQKPVAYGDLARHFRQVLGNSEKE